jgi:hypothetical protein
MALKPIPRYFMHVTSQAEKASNIKALSARMICFSILSNQNEIPPCQFGGLDCFFMEIYRSLLDIDKEWDYLLLVVSILKHFL